MTRTIVSLVSCQAAARHSAALVLRLVELQEHMRADANCLGCELERCADGWQLRGHWLTLQAFEAHLQQPHLQLLAYLVGNGLVRRMEVRVDGYSAGLAS